MPQKFRIGVRVAPGDTEVAACSLAQTQAVALQGDLASLKGGWRFYAFRHESLARVFRAQISPLRLLFLEVSPPDALRAGKWVSLSG